MIKPQRLTEEKKSKKAENVKINKIEYSNTIKAWSRSNEVANWLKLIYTIVLAKFMEHKMFGQ